MDSGFKKELSKNNVLMRIRSFNWVAFSIIKTFALRFVILIFIASFLKKSHCIQGGAWMRRAQVSPPNPGAPFMFETNSKQTVWAVISVFKVKTNNLQMNPKRSGEAGNHPPYCFWCKSFSLPYKLICRNPQNFQTFEQKFKSRNICLSENRLTTTSLFKGGPVHGASGRSKAVTSSHPDKARRRRHRLRLMCTASNPGENTSVQS